MIMSKTDQRPATRLTGLVSVVRPLAFGAMLLVLTWQATAQNAANSQTGTNIIVVPGPTLAEFKAQSELIQKLLGRIDQLEKNDTERAAALAAEAAKAQAATTALQQEHEAREEKLKGRIGELEGKVGSLEAGRVLPEIAITAEDGPTLPELNQQIRILERKAELAAEVAEAKAKESPKLLIGQSGFTLVAADTNFVFKLRGLVQLDSRTFFGDDDLLRGNDSFLLRRARPIIEGTVFRDFDFQIVPDFAGSATTIFDANLNYRLRPEFQLKFGKFKAPIGFEQLQLDTTISFNERSLASALTPTRVVGVQLWGDVGAGAVSYAVGIFNGAGDGRNPNASDFGDEKQYTGRLFVEPFKHTEFSALQGIGLGLGGSYSRTRGNAQGLPSTTGGTLPGYASDGQQQFFAYNPITGVVYADGNHWRLAPQAAYLKGPFGLLGEYTVSHQDVYRADPGTGTVLGRAELEHNAWQVSAQWVLTGEPASFTGITPLRPFDFAAGRWGAWQLVARYGQLNIDDQTFQGFANPLSSAKAATAWGVGINWWLNKNVRVLTSFSHTKFDGGGQAFNPLDFSTSVPPASVTRADEDVFFTRVQISF
jgi:phosphate-selective porin OprO/OprP